MTSFIVKVENELKADAQVALNAAKASAEYVEGVFVTTVEPELMKDFVSLLEQFGSALLSSLFKQIAPGATVTVPTPSAADTASTLVQS